MGEWGRRDGGVGDAPHGGGLCRMAAQQLNAAPLPLSRLNCFYFPCTQAGSQVLTTLVSMLPSVTAEQLDSTTTRYSWSAADPLGSSMLAGG